METANANTKLLKQVALNAGADIVAVSSLKIRGMPDQMDIRYAFAWRKSIIALGFKHFRESSAVSRRHILHQLLLNGLRQHQQHQATADTKGDLRWIEDQGTTPCPSRTTWDGRLTTSRDR